MTQNTHTQPNVRDDKWLKRLAKLGLPIAVVSIACLIIGQLVSSVLLGTVFIVTATIALAIGFIYNMRFISLSAKQRRARRSGS